MTDIPNEIISLENADLAILQGTNGLMVPSGHETAVATIFKNLPAIQETSKNFGKRQSEFMNSMLTVTQPTPLRRARQCCSEIERAWGAIRHNHFKHKKLALKIEDIQLDIKDLEHTIECLEPSRQGADSIVRKRLKIKLRRKQLKLEEHAAGLEAGAKFIGGALRKVAQMSEQYNQILEAAGKTEFTEEDFEEEEIEYHIKTALLQGLTAARAHGGSIDEGNHIYLWQIGINGSAAQKCVDSLLKQERVLLENDHTPDMKSVWEWLDYSFLIFKDDVQKFANLKGQKNIYFKNLCIAHDTPEGE